jgi:hypothetical protein
MQFDQNFGFVAENIYSTQSLRRQLAKQPSTPSQIKKHNPQQNNATCRHKHNQQKLHTCAPKTNHSTTQQKPKNNPKTNNKPQTNQKSEKPTQTNHTKTKK